MLRTLIMTIVLVTALAVGLVQIRQAITPAWAQDSVTAPLGGVDEPASEQSFNPTPPAPEPVVTPAEGGSDFTPILTTIKESLIAVLLALATAAFGWLSTQLARWTGGKIALNDVIRDLNMEDYARRAVDKALNYGLQRTGHTWGDLSHVEIKSQVLRYAVDFLMSQYPEVTKWIDKDQNGIIDWVETLLPTRSPAVGGGAVPIGLMAAPAKKAPKAKPKAKASTKNLDIPAFKEPLAA